MDNTTLREIHQMGLAALEKLCETQSFYINDGTKFKKACKILHLQIKCHEENVIANQRKNITSKNTTTFNKKKGIKVRYFRRKFGKEREKFDMFHMLK